VTVLAQTCISTLLQPDALAIYDFPFAKYAARNWLHHVQCDGVSSQIQDGMERLFDPDKTFCNLDLDTRCRRSLIFEAFHTT